VLIAKQTLIVMVAQDAANVTQDLRLDADFAGLMRMKKNAAHDVERAVEFVEERMVVDWNLAKEEDYKQKQTTICSRY